VEFLAPSTWADALAARSAHPGAVPIAGGTDVMVELNFDRHRPDVLIDLTRVPELREWSRDEGGGVRLGAGVSFARVMTELADAAPGLTMASRTVGSPQIRVRGTVGGNLGSASPAGDAHPVLLAIDAVVEVESVRGTRQVPVAEFFTGVKTSALEPDELISAVLLPPVAGPQQFAKIGTRNAMVIAVTSFGLALHPARQAVGAAIGSAAPTPRHARTAEEFLAGALAEEGLWESRAPITDGTATRFGDLVAADASPIDDVRGTAAYRRHALSVLARRTLGWAWADYQREAA
jgi:CO/xanthine dehydrogenase FAD-binding subunit